MTKKRAWLALGCLLWLTDAAMAAPPSPDVLPGNANPGRILQENQPLPPEAVPVSPGISTSLPAPGGAPAGADKIELDLKNVILDGVTAYTPQELAPIYQPYIGRRIPLSKLYQFAAAITARYRQDGYVTSEAVVPPQHIAGGVIHIRVIEGYIDTIQLQGDIREALFPVLAPIIDRIESYRPLNMKDLERDVLLLNDLAGNTSTAVLKASQKPGAFDGATDLVLTFANVPEHTTVSVDNFNSRYMGTYEMNVQTGLDHLISPYSQTQLNGMVSLPLNEMQYVRLSQRMPLDSYGTAATLQVAYAHTEPGYLLSQEDLDSDSYDYGLSVTHPLIRSRAQNLYIEGDVAVKSIRTEAEDTELYDDQLRIVSAGANYDSSDAWLGSNIAQVKLNQGLDILGASPDGSPNLSRAGGQSDFTDMTATVSRLQRLTGTFNLYVAGTGQYSWSPLLSSEQFGFGGQQFGRAYDPSELLGDDGMAASAELQYNGMPQPDFMHYQLFTFYDIGRVWNYDDWSGGESGASAGAGIRFNAGERISGSLTAAFPLTRAESDPQYGTGYDARILGMVSVQLW